MTRKELEHVKAVLLKIKHKDGSTPPDVALALAHCDKDIARREMQREAQLDNMSDAYEWPFYGQ